MQQTRYRTVRQRRSSNARPVVVRQWSGIVKFVETGREVTGVVRGGRSQPVLAVKSSVVVRTPSRLRCMLRQKCVVRGAVRQQYVRQ